MADEPDMPDATPDRTYDTQAEYPAGRAPARKPKVPSVAPPPGACDAHVHMLGGPADFPLHANRRETPAEGLGFDDWLGLFRVHLNTLGIDRAVLVQSLLYGDDNAITLEAIRRLGPAARGIGLLREDAGEGALDRLREGGIMGLRVHLAEEGILSWEGAERLAPALAARGMHVQMLVNAPRHMDDLAEAVRALPVPVVIDHLGLPDIAAGADGPGVATLCALVEEGHVHVKLSGLYRVADAPWEATDALVDRLVRANPERCLWGSDWPHILLDGAPMPDAGQLLDAFMRAVTNSGDRQRILVDNPARLYDF